MPRHRCLPRFAGTGLWKQTPEGRLLGEMAWYYKRWSLAKLDYARPMKSYATVTKLGNISMERTAKALREMLDRIGRR